MRDMHRRRTAHARPLFAIAGLLLLTLVACSGSSSPSAPEAQPTGSSAPPSPSSERTPLPTLQTGHIDAGTYVLSSSGVVPGLKMTLPKGWYVDENDAGELAFFPPHRPDDRLFFWIGLVPVRSSGPDVGKVLENVGKTPKALISWITSNPDFMLLAKPTPTTIGNIKMTSLTVGISKSANFGHPDCPSNPRCGAFFTNPVYWSPGDTYAIGYPEVTRLSFATIRVHGNAHTLIIGQDSVNQKDLNEVMRLEKPIFKSLRRPSA
jgi:hypothetical protein